MKKIIFAVLLVVTQNSFAITNPEKVLSEIANLRTQLSDRVKTASDESEYRSAVQAIDYLDTLEMQAKASVRSLNEIEREVNLLKAGQ